MAARRRRQHDEAGTCFGVLSQIRRTQVSDTICISDDVGCRGVMWACGVTRWRVSVMSGLSFWTQW